MLTVPAPRVRVRIAIDRIPVETVQIGASDFSAWVPGLKLDQAELTMPALDSGARATAWATAAKSLTRVKRSTPSLSLISAGRMIHGLLVSLITSASTGPAIAIAAARGNDDFAFDRRIDGFVGSRCRIADLGLRLSGDGQSGRNDDRRQAGVANGTKRSTAIHDGPLQIKKRAVTCGLGH